MTVEKEASVAASPSFVQRYFWVVPWAVLSWAGSTDSIDLSDQRAAALALTLGLVVGAVWQLVYRRDLVDRLAALMLVTLVWVVVLWLPAGEDNPTAGAAAFACFGVVVGLAMVERYLRPRP
ncbi:MAG TPA: hypothetical protein VFK52_09755 [Nocardioidaceae bacterium]|nr:hypothetical protein [Nocardioidaceae bacterium]